LKTKDHLTAPVGVASGRSYSASIHVLSPLNSSTSAAITKDLLPENVARKLATFNEFWGNPGN
jgi:hypothetical protein